MQGIDYQQLYDFLEEYTDFLDKMQRDETEKFAALSSRDMARIEHSISVAQANAKQLENFETQRIKLQNRAGLEGLSFREIILKAPEHEQSWLLQLFDRFERSVSDIKFYNDKSMSVARDEMLEIDPSAVLPGAVKQNPYSKLKEETGNKNGMLETKI